MSLVILFICGLLWSIFDLVRKLAIEIYSLKYILYITIFSQLIIFMISLLLSDTSIYSYNYYPLLFIIAILNILSLYLFLKALEIEEISICIPMLSYSPLFSLLFSKLILKEGLSTEQHIGILVIFFGSFVLYSKSLLLKDLLFSPFLLIKNKGAQLIIIVTVIWSVIPVLDKKSLTYTDIYMHGFMQSLLGFILLSFLFFNNFSFNIPKIKTKKAIFILTLLIVIGFSATITQLFALKVNFVPILEVVKRATGILFSLVFGYFFFKEEISKKKLLSVLIIITGLSLAI